MLRTLAKGPGPGPPGRADGRQWLGGQRKGLGPFSKLLNKCVSQRCYFLLASLKWFNQFVSELHLVQHPVPIANHELPVIEVRGMPERDISSLGAMG